MSPFWGVEQHQTKYLLEIKYPQWLGDVNNYGTY